MDIELCLVDSASGYYPKILALRQRILRAPLGLDLYAEDLSEERNQYIVTGLDRGEPVACLMIRILDGDTVKFRQMAVDETMQGQGIGATLLRYAENFCLLNEYRTIELHARATAVGFYEKAGYRTEGEQFSEVGIPHFRMIKHLIA